MKGLTTYQLKVRLAQLMDRYTYLKHLSLSKPELNVHHALIGIENELDQIEKTLHSKIAS